jgi:hypothetical protein
MYVLRRKQKSGWSENNHLYRRVEHWKFSIPVIEEVIEKMFVFYDHFDCLSFYFPTSVLRKFGLIIKSSFISVIPKSSSKIDLSLNQINLSEVHVIVLRRTDGQIRLLHRDDFFEDQKLVGIFNIWAEYLRARKIFAQLGENPKLGIKETVRKNLFDGI